MKELVFSMLALAFSGLTAVAQDADEVQCWYKTWLTPTDCREGVATLQYDELEDEYCVPTGLAGDEQYPFKFKFLPNGEESPLLAIWYRWDNTWFSQSDWTYVQYNDQYQAAIDAGIYYWFTGDPTNVLDGGSLYVPQLAYDVNADDYSALNYYHTPSLIWPYKAPVEVVKGTYTSTETNDSRECDLEIYSEGEYVIKAFNGIKGYDICFADGNMAYFDLYAAWYVPQDWPDYDFLIFSRMACDATPGEAMNVKNIMTDIENGKFEFTYKVTSMSGWNGASYTTDAQEFTGSFTWEVTSIEPISSISSNKQAPVEMFNLNGQHISNPQNGVYIQRKGNKVEKILVK